MRSDFATIGEWIAPGSKVLDFGCGDGGLLHYLSKTKGVEGYGVEIDDDKVLKSIKNGVNVIQADLETGSSLFDSDAFDYVILSLTLQAVRNTEGVIREMLRIGRQGIVTFPNFGFWIHRFQILAGRMPVSSELPYQWYDTPNIHLFTVQDFERYCLRNSLFILDKLVLDSSGRKVKYFSNFFGNLAFYRFKKQKS